jgi:hypothetical protein
MKMFTIKTMLALGILLVAAGCSKKFEENSRNNNLPLSVPPGVVLRGILGDVIVYPGGNEDKASQYIVSNYTYYGDNKYWTGSAGLNFGTLNNVLSMEALAKKAAGSDNNPYHALGLFLRAYFFVNMSEKVGDLPMTEALQGIANTAPKYDTQKDIFKQSLKWLDTANTILSGALTGGFKEFSGDFYFNPSDNASSARAALVKWQKVVNSYKLRVLIELSKRVSTDADLNIKTEFAKIISSSAQYPIFTSNDDNLQYVYNDKYNYYPDNATNYGNNAGRLNPAATWLNILSSLNDIRAMVVAEPARGLGFTDTDYRSFVGAASGADLSTLATQSGAGKLSLYNYNHYYAGLTGEPTFILSYPEVCFSIAEAVNRGWVAGSADTWYQNGTKAMFEFYGIKDGDNSITLRNASGTGNLVYTVPFSFAAYFNQPAVKYKGDNVDGLTQILTQKYLAYARNSGLQGYFQWRRTGVPAFSTGAGTGNGGVIPLRYQYPSGELSTNKDNVSAAIQSQYSGKDDINAKMWLIK